ncbi:MULTISPECIES: aconitate hydratase [unclassified Fusibacter]|uniref:aconitate hydratase n=1 Tax=unclassified Fusibacter TaxID=2624464 RepID=UPI00101332D1|nr:MULTISPECIES: aconitate hydratase [unclassified Fusibacter]MCK8059110.1 aconitate hydratase [Fusibacter sp. A2]NPE22519.1 aconitate hydratase [Fusibacter sp. A1]RXV60622.1 aconitate hydratase [Fusibacter sp. A1]
MKRNITHKILDKHLLQGELLVGNSIKVAVNQTLTQDSTGTMVYLQLEALEVESIKTDLSVAYIDHNMLQTGFENADDHAFIRSVASKYGIVYSKPGNGICHQLHLERFAVPGSILIGSDSHTPTCGGLGALAIGAGGLDIAIGMACGYYYLTVPKVIKVHLKGQLRPWSSAKDVILHVLKTLTVKGGVGAVLEYAGEGVKTLSVTERATITNMGAELGATTSIFPSDENTLDFLTRQGRAADYYPLTADENATYDEELIIDLDMVEPSAALPHSPDNIKCVKEIEGRKVDQVAIGSCTNSSYTDLMKVAEMLKGKRVSPSVGLVISPGSSSVLGMLAKNGALASMISAGARLLEAGCGPCIGMGQAPKSGAVSLRTFNRNFKGRCGTDSADVYLVSPETAVASAISGVITDPRTLTDYPAFFEPEKYDLVENYWISSPASPKAMIERGPNIKEFPVGKMLRDKVSGTTLLKTHDNVTTDDIMPSGAALLPFRSNIPELSRHGFKTLVSDFRDRALKYGGGIVIGGSNYGQGSSREHAALIPLYLGVSAVIAKSFARIHKMNLINAGILPLVFENMSDYDLIAEFDELMVDDCHSGLEQGRLKILNVSTGKVIHVLFEGSPREVELLKAGGALNYVKAQMREEQHA